LRKHDYKLECNNNTMENDKDIKIETEEDVGLDDKIKAGENESPCFAAGKIVKGSKQNKIKYLCDV
jgi:hypothetical protein